MNDNKHDINVKHIADLAAINLSTDEMERFQSQLVQVLSYINQLNEVDISNADDFQNNAITLDELRDDSIKNSIDHEYFKNNAPAYKNDQIQVPKILD
tara:strand:- start:357 stop:650 length:294 start_codon:yes stop_codon:yes gene_type:complete